MEIFIGNLPGTATLLDLTMLLNGIHLRTDFRCCQGRDQQDRNYHFFVARTATREEGEALIEKLDGQELDGHRIEAREYQPRRTEVVWGARERRINPWPRDHSNRS